jgi:ribonuclease HI
MKAGSLNLLETSGPHRACYGADWPFSFTLCALRFWPLLGKFGLLGRHGRIILYLGVQPYQHIKYCTVHKWLIFQGMHFPVFIFAILNECRTVLIGFRKRLEALHHRDLISNRRSGHTIPIYKYPKSFNIIIDADYWKKKDPMFPEDVLIWYTDGSKADSGTESGIHGLRPTRSYCFPLGKFATVFHTEIHAILQCAYENIRTAYKNKRIHIFSDSQAALKASSGPKVTSRLVAEGLDALSALASLNEVTLIWVPRHQGILGKEEADKRAKQTSATPILGPEPALGISKCLAREVIKNWTEHQHYNIWKDLPGCKHGKLFIGRTRKKSAEDPLKLGRHQLKVIEEILTGHAPVKDRLRIIGLFNGDPTCRFCGMETETVQHIICYCESLDPQRYNVFGKPSVEPKDISKATVRDMCLFIRETLVLNLC